jgi:hypothetical protein
MDTAYISGTQIPGRLIPVRIATLPLPDLYYAVIFASGLEAIRSHSSMVFDSSFSTYTSFLARTAITAGRQYKWSGVPITSYYLWPCTSSYKDALLPCRTSFLRRQSV